MLTTRAEPPRIAPRVVEQRRLLKAKCRAEAGQLDPVIPCRVGYSGTVTQPGTPRRRNPAHRYWWAFLVVAGCFAVLAVGRAVGRDGGWQLFVGVWSFLALWFVFTALVLRRENARLH
jgi:hypothetical protein